jgi:hypothetical protein
VRGREGEEKRVRERVREAECGSEEERRGPLSDSVDN